MAEETADLSFHLDANCTFHDNIDLYFRSDSSILMDGAKDL